MNSTKKLKSYKLQARNGQSLIEILVAITIGGMIVGSAVVAIRLSLTSSSQVQRVGSSTPYLSGLIDSARSSAEGDWVTFYNLPGKGSSSKYYFVRDVDAQSKPILRIVTGTEGVLGEDVVSGLIAYWKLDETNGTVAYDASQYNYQGTLNNSPTQAGTSGCKAGRCLSFNGTNQYLGVGDASADLMFAGKTTMSVALWIYPQVTESSKTYFEYGVGSSTFSLEGGTSAVNFYTNNASPIGTSLTVGQWNHIVMVISGSNKYIYKNGALITSTAFTSALSNNSRLSIGGREGTRSTNSLFDDVRIYNRVLSAAEITQLYNSKIYNRSFSVENVNRDDLGRGTIVTSGGLEDPSTQKVVATVTPADTGIAVSATEYLIRSRNTTNLFTDWSGVLRPSGLDANGNPYTSPSSDYSDSTNIDFGTTGSIRVQD